MEEPDEIHDHDLAERHRLDLAKSADVPIEPTERFRSASTERRQHLPNEAGSLDPIPVCRPAMRSYGVEEVVATHAHALGNGRDDFTRERGLAGSTVSGDPNHDRVTPICAASGDQRTQRRHPGGRACDRNMRHRPDLPPAGVIADPRPKIHAATTCRYKCHITHCSTDITTASSRVNVEHAVRARGRPRTGCALHRRSSRSASRCVPSRRTRAESERSGCRLR